MRSTCRSAYGKVSGVADFWREDSDEARKALASAVAPDHVLARADFEIVGVVEERRLFVRLADGRIAIVDWLDDDGQLRRDPAVDILEPGDGQANGELGLPSST